MTKKEQRKFLAAYSERLRNNAAEMMYILKAINEFWTDAATHRKSGASLSPSALILDDSRTIAEAVAEVIAEVDVR